MTYNYNGKEPNKIPLHKLSQKHQDLIIKNESFCMYPWIHLHADPLGKSFPCCATTMTEYIGDTKINSLNEIWNDEKLREIRKKMLNGEKIVGCKNCYEQEASGFFSMRNSANKHFGHRIDLVDETTEDGAVPDMKLIYWDIRFSNLCNLRCRSCGHIYSSNWYDDQVKLAGTDYAKKYNRLIYAGKTETDLLEQLLLHVDYVEQIYFAGGEPLIMEEHYRLLNELLKRGRNKVRLIYNTNFTQTVYKKTNIFDLWKEFKSVSVGASLDGMEKHGEYIRKNTIWEDIEKNRETMLTTCPNVDFYISPTLSIMNVYHIVDFHKNWVSKGFLKPQDLNINILQNPQHLRIDVLPYKNKLDIEKIYKEHIEWLRDKDNLRRAIVGFESAITFMMSDDKSNLIEKFKQKTAELDSIRNENILNSIPELKFLYE